MPMAINAWLFQSTLPLRGATELVAARHARHVKFQSTLPLRGATVDDDDLVVAVEISIHTPLAGSDDRESLRVIQGYDFNPHSPCGERRDSGDSW